MASLIWELMGFKEMNSMTFVHYFYTSFKYANKSVKIDIFQLNHFE